MESLKIVLAAVIAAILYGVAHDQLTARVSIEYFTVFHPPVFPTHSPALLALGWGIIATWWVGAILGVLLAIASRAGSRPKLSVGDLVDPIAALLVVMAAGALLSGVTGYVLASRGMIAPSRWVLFHIPPSRYAAFMFDWFAHLASYAIGLVGGIVVCVTQFRRRARSA